MDTYEDSNTPQFKFGAPSDVVSDVLSNMTGACRPQIDNRSMYSNGETLKNQYNILNPGNLGVNR
jgi:hypothetical protein